MTTRDPGTAHDPAPAADPIAAHLTALAATLHGPPGTKARMLTEARDGLTDAAAALAHDEGMPYDRAARRAVRDFGTVAETAPGFQRELTLVQTRRTARVVALAVPVLVACFHLVVAVEPHHGQPLPGAAQVIAALLVGVAAAAAMLAAAALAATGALARRLPTPQRLPVVVAWTGTVAAVALAAGSLTLTAGAVLAANWPLSALAGALTLAAHTRVAASARACRHCAHLPAPG